MSVKALEVMCRVRAMYDSSDVEWFGSRVASTEKESEDPREVLEGDVYLSVMNSEC